MKGSQDCHTRGAYSSCVALVQVLHWSWYMLYVLLSALAHIALEPQFIISSSISNVPSLHPVPWANVHVAAAVYDNVTGMLLATGSSICSTCQANH